MKPFIRAQLERSVQRLSELDFLLSREDIMQDMTQFMVLSREHAEVVTEIDVNDDAVLRDFDTRESLATLPPRLWPPELKPVDVA